MTRASLAECRVSLRGELEREIGKGAGRPWTDEAFNELALAIFRYQVDANPVYGTFVRNRGIDPAALEDWRGIPAVPSRAFKEVPLVCAGSEPPEAIFRTSGTTQGAEARGEHRVRDLSLYRASLLATATVYLRPDPETPEPVRVLALLPSPADRPDSSLSAMVGAIAEAWGDAEGAFFADADWELRSERFREALAGAAADGTPVLLAGTAFAFVHWLDRSGGGPSFVLPEGSVLLETGGFKGRARRVSREELYGWLQERLGLPLSRMVSEYGMTEMLSQFYEPVLRDDRAHRLANRWHVGPPWVRTRVLDPSTLEPVARGEPGLLSHLDLANLDSVTAILTEDLGVTTEGGFRLRGRIVGSEPRGCSLSMEDLLLARGGGP
ncbi:MAG: hypothetical protein WEG36_02850 [Gemmatimonadota bacterium]